MSRLFAPLEIRGVRFRNRVFVSPMCQYQAVQGVPTDWHLVHLGSRAVGGAGLVMTEATAVLPDARISPADTGLWNDEQADAFRRIAAFIKRQGAVPGIQLAHAGRKASTAIPWEGGAPLGPDQGGWPIWGPSPVPFDLDDPVPRQIEGDEFRRIRDAFAAAAVRARGAGFEVVEIHMAHGYLMHSFLSPLSNRRDDEYGGSWENRVRFPLEVAGAVRGAWPEAFPVFVRISATDWVEGGWDLPQSIRFARELKKIGVDLVDGSSGGIVHDAKIPAAPGYQVPFAAAVRREAGIATAAVGLITEPEQAEKIVASGDADAVFLAREFLRQPYWPLHAARRLGADIDYWPVSYLRARS